MFKRILFVSVVMTLILSACGGQPTPAPAGIEITFQATALPPCSGYYGNMPYEVPAGQTVNFPQPRGESVDITCGPDGQSVTAVQIHANGQPYTSAEIQALLTATAQPATAMPPTATAPAESCLAALPKSVNRPFQWVNNLDVGDAKLTSLLYVANNSGDSLVALIDPVFNYDVEAPKMTGAYYQTNEWSVEKLTCAARELADQNGVTNLVYIGLGETPSGFSRDYHVTGFTTSIWVYTEAPIDTTPARWETFTAAKSDRSHMYGNNDAYMYGQFWNGINSKTVYHWITEPGWQITTPALQGTYWAVYDWSDVLDLVLARFIQMTGEVEQRDGHPLVIKVYCGYNDSPTGYSKPTQPSDDWICEPMP